MKSKFLLSNVIIIILSKHLVSAQVSSTLIPYRSGELWGYCTKDKKIVIPPIYEYADWFRDGLALVSKDCVADCYENYDGVFGFIDSTGKVIIPISYSDAFPFKKGTAYVRESGEDWYEIDTKGKIKKTLNSLPEEVKNNIFESPKEFKKVEGDIPGRFKFMGYKSEKNVTYWDNPETTFFLKIDSISVGNEEINQPFVRIQSDVSIAQNVNFGRKMQPSLVLISSGNGEIKTERYFPLKKYVSDSEDSKYYYLISNYSEIAPYIPLINNPGDQKLMFTASYLIPTDSLKRKLLFRLYQKGVVFISTELLHPIIDYSTSLYEFSKDYYTGYFLGKLAADIQQTGKFLIKSGDSQNRLIEDENNPYKGKKLFDVMISVKPSEVLRFLEYVDSRPFIYSGSRIKISDAFASWVFQGAP